ncbi:CLUMA_CG010444, isoform A [Clunio marinus]|uniref:CLUMA_CG010444, isoform A n=1 Tax=Clunio marinus TaxID=568069 RepID=A0A1J1I9U5_9DIPT|nr:CLUMA_CG010444, isoform A [Clunio marinus]
MKMKIFISIVVIFSSAISVKALFFHNQKSNSIPLDFNGVTSSLFGGKTDFLGGSRNLFNNNYNSYAGNYNSGVRSNGYLAPSYGNSGVGCVHSRGYNDYNYSPPSQPSYSYQYAPSYTSSGYNYQAPVQPIQPYYSSSGASYGSSSGYNYPSTSQVSYSSGYNYQPPQRPFYPSSGISSIEYVTPSVEYLPQAPSVYTQPPIVEYSTQSPAPVVYTTPATVTYTTPRPIVEYSTAQAPVVYSSAPVVYSQPQIQSVPVNNGYSYETQPISNSWSSSGLSDSFDKFSDSSLSSSGGHAGLKNIFGSIAQIPSKAINAKLNAVSGVVNSKIKVLENLSGLVSGGLHNSHG